MKPVLAWTLGGVFLGIALTAWLAPRLIVWYFNPPVEMGLSCNAPITWALHRLLWTQLGGVVLGGALGLGVYGVIQRRRARTQDPQRQRPESTRNTSVPPP